MNPIPQFVLLPMWLLVGGLVVWLIVRSKARWPTRIGLSVAGAMVLIGFGGILLGVEYLVDRRFALSVQYYWLSSLPKEDPFEAPPYPADNPTHYTSTLALVYTHSPNGQLRLWTHEDTKLAASDMILFAPHKFVHARLENGWILPEPETLTETSIWWALTKRMN
jgi:hypothetical protein